MVHILRPTSTKARIHYYYHRKAKPDGATTAGCFRVGCHGNALGQPRGAAWNNHPLASFPRFTLLSQHSLSLSLSLSLARSFPRSLSLPPSFFPPLLPHPIPMPILPLRLFPRPHILPISVPPAVLTSGSHSSLQPLVPWLAPPTLIPRHHGAVVIRLPCSCFCLRIFLSYSCPNSFHHVSPSSRSLSLSISWWIESLSLSLLRYLRSLLLRLIVLLERALFRQSGYHPLRLALSLPLSPRSIMRETCKNGRI